MQATWLPAFWKALGYVLRLIHADITQNIVSLDTEKLSPKELPAWGACPPPLEKQGGAWVPPPGSDVYEFLKTPHRLVRGQYRGIVWAKEEGSWRNLEICMSPKVGGGGGAETSFRPPPPWRMGQRAPPLPPLFLRLC